MEDVKKTKKQLIEEIEELRNCLAQLKGFEEEIKQTRVNHEKFTKAFLQNSVPASITNLKDGRYVDVSDAFLRLSGCKRDEVIGRTSMECGFITEEQRASFYNKLNKKGRIENLEMKVRTKGGALRDGLFNAVMMSLNNEKYLLAVITDITERKQAEEALRESEVRFRELFNHMSSGVAVYEAVDNGGDFIFRDFNPAAEKIEKTSRKNILGKRVSEAFPGVKPFGIFEVFQRVWQTGKPEYFPQNIYKDKRNPGSWRDNWVVKLPTGEIVAIYNDITDRKSMERALAEEHQRLLSILDGSPVSSFVIDRDHRVTAWNLVNEFFTGISKEDILGKPLDLSPLFDGKVPPALADLVLEMSDEEIIKRYGHKGIRKSEIHPQAFESTGSIWIKGKERIMAIQATRLRDAAGNVIGAIQCAQDITNQKRAEEALRESEGKLNAMLQSIADHMSVMDEELNIIWANKAATQRFGSNIIGRKCYEAYHSRKEPCEPYPCITLKAFKDGEVHEHDTEVVDKEGKTIYFHCTANVASRDKEDKPVTVLEISRDITEHKQAEGEIRRGNRFLNSIIENIPITIFLKDARELRFVLLNRAGEDLTGYSSADLLGKNDYDFTTKEQADFFTEKDREVLRGRDVMDIQEEPLQTRNQGERILHTKKVPIMDANGEPEYLLGISEDITDRKRMEEELINHRIQLEELVKERTVELENKTRMLEDINIALKVLLRQRDVERQDLEDRFVVNIKTLILPYVEKMKSEGLDARPNAYLSIMESNLNELLSPLIHNMRQLNFTPKEIIVASLIKDGKTTKDIAETMGVGTSAIDSHRNRIRKKLGLNKRNANLQSYLHSLK